MKNKPITIEIDKLTNSIENRITGDRFDTQIIEVNKKDFKNFEGVWSFDWKAEFEKERKIFKLIIEKNYEVIQGLISLVYRNDFVFVALIESADFNIGHNKIYYGMAGNLFAFACKESWDKGDFGYVSFNAKTNLIPYYQKFLGAQQVGNSS